MKKALFYISSITMLVIIALMAARLNSLKKENVNLTRDLQIMTHEKLIEEHLNVSAIEESELKIDSLKLEIERLSK